ncbi:hypothetical protein P0W64_16420 [Tsukamurella sp. 8F]|nr:MULTISPECIES: hypothetical protein [unclassified Tsukamurella]MDF0531120.1 hypothetical protein [Tsukamurella sp. 8J]MDF0588366.1 hypothetical protein [Tsukamurella sp. 8F]
MRLIADRLASELGLGSAPNLSPGTGQVVIRPAGAESHVHAVIARAD